MPVFILGGTGDRNTLIAETREMFASSREPKMLWEAAGAGHADPGEFARETCQEKIRAFFQKWL